MSARWLALALVSCHLVLACTSPPARGSVGALCAADDECAVGLSCRAGVCAEPASDAGPSDAGATMIDTGSGSEIDAAAEDTGRVVTYGTPCTCPGSTTGCDSCRPGLLCDVFGEGVPSVAGTCVDACVFTGACDTGSQFCDSVGTSGGGCVNR